MPLVMPGWLAARPPDEEIGPGLLGFVVFIALGVVTYLLWRSMNHQLRKVDFEDTGRVDEAAASTDRDPPPPPGT